KLSTTGVCCAPLREQLPPSAPFPLLQFQGAHRECLPTADVDLSSMSAEVPGESPLVSLPGPDSNLVPLSRRVPESRLHRRPQTSSFLSASRKARIRTRRCQSGDQLAGPSLVPGTCTRPCP